MTESDVERIQKAAETIDALVEKYIPEPRKSQLAALFEGEMGKLYFSAPASSKKQYHYPFPGGLALHSVNLFKNLQRLNIAFKLGFSDEKMLFCALLHDFGKCSKSDGQTPHYVPVIDDYKKRQGKVYEYDEHDGVYFPTHQRTMFLLQKLGLVLEADEYQAILLNDGQYINENKPYSMKECPLAMYLHIADRIACEQEKEIE